MKNFQKRIARLEGSLARQPSTASSVIESAKLLDTEKEILRRAIGNQIVVARPEELDRLNASIDALPEVERARIRDATKAAVFVAISEGDEAL